MSDKKKSENLKAPEKLKVLFTIINRKKTDYYIDLLESYEVNMQNVVFAHGTAPSDIAHFLGLEDNDKSVILSVIKESKETDILDILDEKFKTIKDGKGIAFTISLTSVIGVLIYKFLSNQKEGLK